MSRAISSVGQSAITRVRHGSRHRSAQLSCASARGGGQARRRALLVPLGSADVRKRIYWGNLGTRRRRSVELTLFGFTVHTGSSKAWTYDTCSLRRKRPQLTPSRRNPEKRKLNTCTCSTIVQRTYCYANRTHFATVTTTSEQLRIGASQRVRVHTTQSRITRDLEQEKKRTHRLRAGDRHRLGRLNGG